MSADGRHPLFDTGRRRAGLTITQLWVRYAALGGIDDRVEIDAFLSGVLPLDALQQDVLAHAVNERLDDLFRAARIPYLIEPPPAPPAPRGDGPGSAPTGS